MTFPPGSFALIVVLVFWIVMIFGALFLIVFPRLGRGRGKRRKISEQSAS